MRTLICGALVAALLIVAGEAAADPRGLWLTEGGKSHVRLHACEHNKKLLCGEIVWLRNPRKDVENEDKSLRDRPLVGIMAVWDLEHQGGADWDDGSIYNPEDGETYDSELEEIDADTVKVRGCVWFICKTQVWERVEEH